MRIEQNNPGQSIMDIRQVEIGTASKNGMYLNSPCC